MRPRYARDIRRGVEMGQAVIASLAAAGPSDRLLTAVALFHLVANPLAERAYERTMQHD